MNTLKDILKYTEKEKDIKVLEKKSLIDILDNTEKYGSKINDKSIELLKSIKELIEEYLTEKIKDKNILSDPHAVINFAKSQLNGAQNEKLIIIYLNTKNEVINHECHSEGTVDQSLVYPRRIIKSCLDNNAAGLIIIHNHPSGHCYPSKEDGILTKKIKDCCAMIDVKLLDHIIIGNNDYYSFQEEKAII